MPIRKPKPTSASRSLVTYADTSKLYKKPSEKTLTVGHM